MTTQLPIIALHGAGMGPGVWDGLAALLPGLEALEFPGHGDGQAPLESIPALADFVRGRLPGECLLLGHSMGALVAAELAGTPGIRGLVLLSAGARMPVNAELLQLSRDDPPAAAALILKWGARGASEAALLKLRAIMRRGEAGLHAALAACDAYVCRGGSLPALVVSGGEDRMVGAGESAALAALFPGARHHVLAGAGHMLMIDRAGELAGLVNGFATLLT